MLAAALWVGFPWSDPDTVEVVELTTPEVPSVRLSPVPDSALVEESPYGLLPRIGPDGRKPSQVYARPADDRDDRPRIVLIVTGVGLSVPSSLSAIEALPPDITLALDPYATDPRPIVDAARAAGHETLLTLPLEPANRQFRDPGPLAVLSTLSARDNTNRLSQVLASAVGYVGVVAPDVAAFQTNAAPLEPPLSVLDNRGLMVVFGPMPPGTPVIEVADDLGVNRVVADLWVDEEPSASAIDAQLAALEAEADRRAIAVGLAHLYPITIERIERWARALGERGVVLTPASAVANRQFLEGS